MFSGDWCPYWCYMDRLHWLLWWHKTIQIYQVWMWQVVTHRLFHEDTDTSTPRFRTVSSCHFPQASRPLGVLRVFIKNILQLGILFFANHFFFIEGILKCQKNRSWGRIPKGRGSPSKAWSLRLIMWTYSYLLEIRIILQLNSLMSFLLSIFEPRLVAKCHSNSNYE